MAIPVKLKRLLKKGGYLAGRDKNGQNVKLTNSKRGGIAVGAKHGTEGGIKGEVGTEAKPIEFEGEEIIITAPAVKDNTRREFNGKMMTNREILSEINQSGGGVAFAKGGELPGKIRAAKDKTYKIGGKLMTAKEVVEYCGCGCAHAAEEMAAGGQTKDFTAIGRSVKKTLRSNESFEILDADKELEGSTWTAGGCYPLARALKEVYGGELKSIVDKWGNQHHILLAVGGGYLDGDGFSDIGKKIAIQVQENVVSPRLADFNEEKINGIGIGSEKTVKSIIALLKKDFEEGGSVSFSDKVSAITKNLRGQPVPAQYRKEYGKTYTAATAREAATKIAGAIVRDEKMEEGGKIDDIDESKIEKILNRAGFYSIKYKGVEIPIKSEREQHDKGLLNIWIGEYGSQFGKRLIIYNKKYDKRQSTIDEFREKIIEAHETFVDNIEIYQRENDMIAKGAKYFSHYSLKNLLKSVLPEYIGKEENALSGSDYLFVNGKKIRFADHQRPPNSKWNFIHGEDHYDAPEGLMTQSQIEKYISFFTEEPVTGTQTKLIIEFMAEMPIPERKQIKEFSHGGPVSRRDALDLVKKINPLPSALAAYKNADPGELLNYIQDQSVGFISGRERVNYPPAYYTMIKLLGKDVVLACVQALDKYEKEMLVKAWKGRIVPKELRDVVKQTLADGGIINEDEPINRDEIKADLALGGLLDHRARDYKLLKTTVDFPEQKFERGGHTSKSPLEMPRKQAEQYIESASRRELIELLKKNDPNGIYTDEQSLQEFGKIASKEDLIESFWRSWDGSDGENFAKGGIAGKGDAEISIIQDEDDGLWYMATVDGFKILHNDGFDTKKQLLDFLKDDENLVVVKVWDKKFAAGGQTEPETRYQIKNNHGGYYSRLGGSEHFNAVPDFGLLYNEDEARDVKDRLQKRGYTGLAIVPYKPQHEMAYAAGGPIETPQALGSALKAFFKAKYGLNILTRYIKTVRGLDGSWYEISTYRSRQIIPNEVRQEVIKRFRPNAELQNWDDISYGNIQPQNISLYGREWKEFLQAQEGKFAKGGPTLKELIEANKDRIILAKPASSIQYPASNYANAYELNKAIEKLLDNKPDNADFTADEKSFLKYYSGYGGLEKFGATGKGLLYEYFTPSLIAEKMWGLAYKYGFKGGPVLEPSAGIGEFIKYAPDQHLVVAHEINKYSARICKILYPLITISTQYFEEIFIKNNDSIKGKINLLPKYKLVIGNPPYGEFGGKWAGMGEKSYTRAGNYIDYFIFRGLDLLETGGLLIFIVGAEVASGGKCFLSQQMNKCKDEIMEKSDLLDAYRLPNGVFERTDVLSDIIVLRKK